MKSCRTIAVATLITATTLCASPRSFAGTPEEAQLGGLIYAVLSQFIIAEFGGHRETPDTSWSRALLGDTVAPSNNPPFNRRPICGPADYDDLREAAKGNTAPIDIRARCRLIETKTERLHVHGFAYLPAGQCEPLKTAINTILAERVHGAPKEQPLANYIVEYKGSSIIDVNWYFARSSQLMATCQDDGSIRLTGRRNREPARLAAEDSQTMSPYSIAKVNVLAPAAIIGGALVGLLMSGWRLVLVVGALLALAAHYFYFGAVLIVFEAPFGKPWRHALYFTTTVAAYLFWAAIFFSLKALIKRRVTPQPSAT
jgi:hypothetical protein